MQGLLRSPEGIFLVLALLHLVGKGLTHQMQDREWARTPLIEGLPISDLYHACSGCMWPVIGWMAWQIWGADWRWWIVGLVLGGLLWPLTKWEKAQTIGWRAVLAEAWWLQIGSAVINRLQRKD